MDTPEILIIALTEGELAVLQKALDALHMEIQRRSSSPRGVAVSPDDKEMLRHWRTLVAKLPEWEAL